MEQIVSTLMLKNVEKEKLINFIEHWKKIKDLPCEDIKIKEINKRLIQLDLFYSLDIFDKSVTQFITVLFGELSFIKTFGSVQFVDLRLPEEVYTWFKGPKFGIEGIKKKFNVKEYPILIAIIKPSLGKELSKEKIEQKIKSVLDGGFHGIKDDEMQGNLPNTSLKDRVNLAKKYRRYIPVLNLDNINDYKKILASNEAENIGAVLLNASTIGFETLHEISKMTKVPLLSHPALQGVYRSSFSPKVFAMLHRLFGCDGYISPLGDKDYFNVTREEEKQMVIEFTKDLPIKKTFPLLCGGARINNIKEVMEPYEEMKVPYGLVFGSQVFSYEEPSKMCEEIIKEVNK